MIQNSNNLKLTHYPSYKSRSNKIVIPNPFHHQSQTSKLFFKNTTKFPKTTKTYKQTQSKTSDPPKSPSYTRKSYSSKHKAIHPNICMVPVFFITLQNTNIY